MRTLLGRELDDNLAVNPLTLAEVLVAPTRANRVDAALSILSDLEIETLQSPVDAGVLRLAHLRATTQLKMPECRVLLSAEDWDARLASFDARLVQVARSRGLMVLDS